MKNRVFSALFSLCEYIWHIFKFVFFCYLQCFLYEESLFIRIEMIFKALHLNHKNLNSCVFGFSFHSLVEILHIKKKNVSLELENIYKFVCFKTVLN